MFKVTDTPRFVWPVEVRLPSATEPGKIETQTFTGHFVLLGKDRMDEMAAAMATANSAGADATYAETMTQIRNVLVGWGDDVVDDDGAAIPFSAEALDDICRFPQVREAIAIAYGEAASGKARLGN